MFKILNVVAASLALTSGASAVTVISSANGPDTGVPVGQYLVTNFNTADGLTGVYSRVFGSVKNSYARPLGDYTKYLAVMAGNTATLTLTKAVGSLSFYWGSIDDFNTVSFYSGSLLVASYTGGDVNLAPADGSQANPVNNRRVSFDFGGTAVTSVAFSSTTNAFELDTVSAGPVPEPATWAMLITGMALVGVSMRRRNRRPTVVAA